MHWDVLAQPTVVVNRFRVKQHGPGHPDRYIYIPATSFKLPGDQTRENVDLPEQRFPCDDAVIQAQTYVFDGPAFLAWPAGQQTITVGTGEDSESLPLGQFVARKIPGVEMTGRTLDAASRPTNPNVPDLAGFSALPAPAYEINGVVQIYEHIAQDAPPRRFMYDALKAAHDGWGEGAAVFWAVPLGAVADALAAAAKKITTKPPSPESLTSDASRKKIADATAGLLEPGRDVSRQTLDNLLGVLTGEGLPVRAFTVGSSIDAGFLVSGTCETGLVLDLAGKVLDDYLTLSLGLAIAAGVTFNLTVGAWWGPSTDNVLEAIQGSSVYFMAGATAFVGVNIFVVCTENLLPFGLIVSPQAGLEVEIGGGWGSLYTWF
jgi:hypothetical protein